MQVRAPISCDSLGATHIAALIRNRQFHTSTNVRQGCDHARLRDARYVHPQKALALGELHSLEQACHVPCPLKRAWIVDLRAPAHVSLGHSSLRAPVAIAHAWPLHVVGAMPGALGA